jgi:alanine dehydrogenase
MKIRIPKEIVPNERRVALTPDSFGALAKLGPEVLVEDGAGESAFFANSDYEQAKAWIVDRYETLATS